MEGRLLLWVYLLSGGVSLVTLLRRRRKVDRLPAAFLVLFTAAAAAGLRFPALQTAAVWAGGAGFVLLFVVPGLLVRLARRQALRGRFDRAFRLFRPACLLFGSPGLRAERDVYRAVAEAGPGADLLAAEVRARLARHGGSGADRRPARVTLCLAGTLVLVHLLVSLGGSTRSVLTLLEAGADYGPLVRAGEAWRLLTAVFLHIGLLHLVFNVLAVLVIGRWVEPEIGAARTLSVFLLSGILGNVVSLVFLGGPELISAGASGGAMGLAGCAAALRLPRRRDRTAARQLSALLLVIGATVFLGLVEEGIDNGAHLGGLAAGFVMGILSLRSGPRSDRAAAVSAGLLLAAAAASGALALGGLPGWRKAARVETEAFTLSVPGRFETHREAEAWVLRRPPLGEIRIEVAPGRSEAVLIALLRLEQAKAEFERERRQDPDLEVTASGPELPSGPGVHRIGTVRASARGTGRRIDLYLATAPDSARAAVLRFDLPAGDETVRRRIRAAVLSSFRLR